MKNKLQNLVVESIASAITIDPSNLRLIEALPLLPVDDVSLYDWNNNVPVDDALFYVPEEPSFTNLYKKLLDAQKESMISTMAKNNYQNDTYWLNPETPIYSPNRNAVFTTVNNSAGFNYSFDSKKTDPQNKLSGSMDAFFGDFKTLPKDSIDFRLHFDKIALIPLSYGGWFTSAQFVKAYQDKNSWVTGPELITWDDLFGEDGIMQLINNGLLAGSGMNIEIQFFGNYSEADFDAVKKIVSSVWPFNLNEKYIQNDFELFPGESIKITISSSPSSIFILAMQVEKVNHLMG